MLRRLPSQGEGQRSIQEHAANKPLATNPKCPKGIIQWQHGKFKKLATGALELEPIKVDGRQMYSDPCQNKHSVYTRYNASEEFQVGFSPYFHNHTKLTYAAL